MLGEGGEGLGKREVHARRVALQQDCAAKSQASTSSPQASTCAGSVPMITCGNGAEAGVLTQTEPVGGGVEGFADGVEAGAQAASDCPQGLPGQLLPGSGFHMDCAQLQV